MKEQVNVLKLTKDVVAVKFVWKSWDDRASHEFLEGSELFLNVKIREDVAIFTFIDQENSPEIIFAYKTKSPQQDHRYLGVQPATMMQLYKIQGCAQMLKTMGVNLSEYKLD